MGVNQMTGTPWHLETLKMNEDDERRHKSRCIHYNKANKFCKKQKRKCPGSAHCDYYKEDPARVKTAPEPERLSSTPQYAGPTVAVTPINKPIVSDISEPIDITTIFTEGCHARHKKYGLGIVRKIDGDYITVEFDNELKKELSLEYCVKKSLLIREYTDEEIRIAKEKEAERKAEEQRLREIELQKDENISQAITPIANATTLPTNSPNNSVVAAYTSTGYSVSSSPYAYTKPQYSNVKSKIATGKSDNSKASQIVCWAIWLAVAVLLSIIALGLSIVVNSWVVYLETVLAQLYLCSLFVITNPFTSENSNIRLLRRIINHRFRVLLIATLVWIFLSGYLYGAIEAFNYM